jgi:carbon-monoxide dehydrogenase medium subunit
VIPTAFDYHRATSLDDAIAKLGQIEGAKLLAGGHSLVPLMKLRLSEPQALVDISRLPELAGIRQKDGRIEIGAAATHHDVASSTLLRDACPVIGETAAVIGDPQVRNRGTLGGSLAHADPAADYPATILALDATIHLLGAHGARVVKASDFFLDLFTVDLGPNEIVTAVSFAPVRSAAYVKLHQRASHFAIVGVAAALRVEAGVTRSARVALTGATTHAMRLSNVEAAVTGKAASHEVFAEAAKLASEQVPELNSDIHASAEYRRAMIAVFTRRALEQAAARA